MIVFSPQSLRETMVAFVVISVCLVPLGLFRSRSTGRSLLISVAYSILCAAVIAITAPLNFELIVTLPAPNFSAHMFFSQFVSLSSIGDALTSMLSTPERMANIALFIPLTLIGYFWHGKRWVALPVAALLSFGIELAQALSGIRDGSVRDFANNAFGALLGFLLAWLLHRLVVACSSSNGQSGQLEVRPVGARDGTD